MIEVTNRIAELQSTLRLMANEPRRQSIMATRAAEGGRRILALIRQFAPVGTVEPSYMGSRGPIVHGRPSLRLHGVTMEGGWQPIAIEPVAGGSSFSISTTAPQVVLLMRGTTKKNYPISRVSFWWGAPLPWPAKDGKPAGGRYFPEVAHPGRNPNLFVQRALEAGLPYLIEQLRRGVVQILDPLHQFFRGQASRPV